MNRRVLPSKPKRKAERFNGHAATHLSPRTTSTVIPPASLMQCLKCQGSLIIQEVTLARDLEIRCLNCGWQPQYGQRVIQETEEARSIRRFTAGLFGGASNSNKKLPRLQ